jgi:hypothetical protein
VRQPVLFSLLKGCAFLYALIHNFRLYLIDLETLSVTPNLLLSTPMALRLPLRWLAILCGRVHATYSQIHARG